MKSVKFCVIGIRANDIHLVMLFTSILYFLAMVNVISSPMSSAYISKCITAGNYLYSVQELMGTVLFTHFSGK